MNPKSLKAFIENYVELNHEDWKIIAPKFQVETYKKGTHLLKKGEVCRELFF